MDSYVAGNYSPGSGITDLPAEQRDMILSGWTIGVKGATDDKGFADLEEQRKYAEQLGKPA